ncbi:MAG: dihydrodipicolinate synthase family protein [Candidatus Fimimonas sp.]
MQLITALATPFCNGKIDFGSYEKLLERQQSADRILCAGTTAEGGLLTQNEKSTLVGIAKSYFPKTPVWVGISCGCTNFAVEEAICAKKAGASGLLVSPPAFFKCTKEGFTQHILHVCNATGLPVMLYNAPSRCGYTLNKGAVKTLALLAPQNVFLKDAGNDADYVKELSRILPVFCGNEEYLPQFAQSGAVGVVSVVANVAPELTKKVMEFWQENAQTQVQDLAQTPDCVKIFHQLARLAFCQLNPIPIKYMLHKANVFKHFDVRLPLTSADEQTQRQIDEFWEEHGEEIC